MIYPSDKLDSEYDHCKQYSGLVSVHSGKHKTTSYWIIQQKQLFIPIYYTIYCMFATMYMHLCTSKVDNYLLYYCMLHYCKKIYVSALALNYGFCIRVLCNDTLESSLLGPMDNFQTMMWSK